MKSKVLKYIIGWNEERPKKSKISMVPTSYSGEVYNIEVRFPASIYGHADERDFEKMTTELLSLSAGTLVVHSTYLEFETGILSLKVAIENIGYDDKHVVKALRKLVSEIIPSFGEDAH